MDTRMACLRTRVLLTAGLLGSLVLAACSRGGADDLKHDLGLDLGTYPSYDFGLPIDLSGADLRVRDLGTAGDLATRPDMESRSPCRRGVGWTAFSFHYKNSTTAVVDTIGLPDRSNFQVNLGTFTVFDDAGHGGGLDLESGNYILVRFSVDGLTRISSATLTVFGRSYDTTTRGSFRASSPLHGDISTPTNAVSNAWPYDWTSVDYTANVRVGDAKNSTSFRLFAGPSSNDLIVNTVELCIDGS